jgi:hypothetical protein
MHDSQPSPVPIYPVASGDPNVRIQQLVVGQDRQQRPYILTITAHKETGDITARLGQTLAFPAELC